MKRKIIAINGLAGSGKDTIADLLVRDHGFTKIALADPLKRICRDVFGFTDEQLWGPSEKRNAPDWRYPRDHRFEYPHAPVGSVWVPLDRGYTLISAEDFDAVSAHKWIRSVKEAGKNTDYVRRSTDGLALHRFIMDPHESQQVDHRNGDGLDNRRTNLRLCSLAENRRNEAKRLPDSASSKFKGVTWDKSRDKWSAKITVGSSTQNLGRFDSEIEAAMAYDRAAKRAFGDFARTNSDLFLTPRYALQTLGTNWGRDCYPDVWIDYAMRIARGVLESKRAYTAQLGLVPESLSTVAGVVISDARFRNEFERIRSEGGKLIRVVRAGAGLEGEAANHRSETESQELPDDFFDHVIQNDSTLEDLRARVRGLELQWPT